MTTTPTNFKVDIWNYQTEQLVDSKTFQTEEEALQFITVSIDEDMEYGDYETYDYFLNGKVIS